MAPPPPIQGPPFPHISPIAINCDGVAQLLNTLDVHKATGPDHNYLVTSPERDIFRNSTIINYINYDLPSITTLVLYSIQLERSFYYPMPLFKKGDH